MEDAHSQLMQELDSRGPPLELLAGRSPVRPSAGFHTAEPSSVRNSIALFEPSHVKKKSALPGQVLPLRIPAREEYVQSLVPTSQPINAIADDDTAGDTPRAELVGKSQRGGGGGKLDESLSALLSFTGDAVHYAALARSGVRSIADINLLEGGDHIAIPGLPIVAWRRIRKAAATTAASSSESPRQRNMYLSPRQYQQSFPRSPRLPSPRQQRQPAASQPSAAVSVPPAVSRPPAALSLPPAASRPPAAVNLPPAASRPPAAASLPPPADRSPATGAVHHLARDLAAADAFASAVTRSRTPQSASSSGTKQAPLSPVRRLSAAQLNEYRDAFRLYDKDGSGAINNRELQGLLESVNLSYSDDEIEAMMHIVDTDGSGEIEYSEFLSLMARQAEEQGDLYEGTPGILGRRSRRTFSDDSYERLVDGETRQLPMRRSLMALRRVSKLKSFIAFIIFYVTYISLSTVRLDWWHGHETLVWLRQAHVHAGVQELDKAEEVSQVADYLDRSIARVTGELYHLCDACEVGITPRSRDMTFLGLEDFVCSDFDSKIGQRDYPSRDCEAEDRTWAASPSSLTAPCCANATLVKASVAMMTEALAYGITELPLETLLSGGTDPSYSSTEYFVKFYIEHNSFILQLIISRQQRMTGVSNYVGKRKKDAPLLVDIVPGYWSFNYDNMELQQWLLWLMLFSGGFTLAHDRRLMVDHFCGESNLLRFEVQQHKSQQRTFLQELFLFFRRWSLYVVSVQIPSILLPLLVELCMPFLQLPVWCFWVVFTEMLLSIRMLHEGTLVPGLRRVVAVLDEATPNIFALVAVLAPLMALTSLMHSQLFGLFDEGFSDPFVSLTRIINMLTAPPPQSNTEGEIFESQERGAELLFYWSTFVIRLCFGSFIVAILVGAFNKVVGNEAEAKRTHKRDESLPSGFVSAADRSGCERVLQFGDFFLTARLFGSYEPWLIQALETQIALTECEDETEQAKKEQLMVSAGELAELVGARPAVLLLSAYGARPVHAPFDA